MSTRKIIYWHPTTSKQPKQNEKGEETRFANIHLLITYNQGTITDYQAMAAEMRQTFPEATDDKVRCARVNRSSQVDGATLLIFDAEIPKREYPGWHEAEKPEYSW